MKRCVFFLFLPFSLMIGGTACAENVRETTADVGTPSAYESVTPRYRIVMPAPIRTEVRENVRTLWGRSTVTTHTADLGDRSYFIFMEYSFASGRRPSPERLKQARSDFLWARKCIAEDIPPPPVWMDERGEMPPQTLFTGYCAAPERFMVLTALAHDNIYQLQVILDLRNNELIDVVQAMLWLIDHAQLTYE